MPASTSALVKAVQKVSVVNTAAIAITHPGGVRAIFIVRNDGPGNVQVTSNTVITAPKTLPNGSHLQVVDTTLNIGLVAAADVTAMITVESQPAPATL